MNQEYGKYSRYEEVPDEEEQARDLGDKAIKNTELEEKTDDLLDEIDDVLEENAEDFVRDFIQKGGQ